MIIRCISCDSSFRLNPFLLKDFKGARVSCRRCGASIVAMNPLIPPLTSKRKNSEPFSVAPSITPPVDGHANMEIMREGNPSTYPKLTAPTMETWTPPRKTENVDVRPEGKTDSDHELWERKPISPHGTTIRGKHNGIEEKFGKGTGGSHRISSRFMPPGTYTRHQPKKDFGEKITERAFVVSGHLSPEPIDISRDLIGTSSFSSDVSLPGKKGIPNPMKSPMPITLKKEFVLGSPSEVLPLENRFQWWTDIALLLLIALFAGLFGYSLS